MSTAGTFAPVARPVTLLRSLHATYDHGSLRMVYEEAFPSSATALTRVRRTGLTSLLDRRSAPGAQVACAPDAAGQTVRRPSAGEVGCTHG